MEKELRESLSQLSDDMSGILACGQADGRLKESLERASWLMKRELNGRIKEGLGSRMTLMNPLEAGDHIETICNEFNAVIGAVKDKFGIKSQEVGVIFDGRDGRISFFTNWLGIKTEELYYDILHFVEECSYGDKSFEVWDDRHCHSTVSIYAELYISVGLNGQIKKKVGGNNFEKKYRVLRADDVLSTLGVPTRDKKGKSLKESVYGKGSYEDYQLKWLADHGYSVKDVFKEAINCYIETMEYDPDDPIEDAWDLFLDSGLNGEIFAGKSEWSGNERL